MCCALPRRWKYCFLSARSPVCCILFLALFLLFTASSDQYGTYLRRGSCLVLTTGMLASAALMMTLTRQLQLAGTSSSMMSGVSSCRQSVLEPFHFALLYAQLDSCVSSMTAGSWRFMNTGRWSLYRVSQWTDQLATRAVLQCC